ncbi:MAG TPA: PEP-CTERM system TPR-repeat protein PrsT [Rubrivivax sp.]|nr:PEP-CTERM system TPR-repeat protein PrsT [Rubrivivax sp.]
MPKELLPRFVTLALLAVLAAGFSGCGGESTQDLVSSAKAKLEKEDSKGAVIQLKTALQQSPQSAEARYLLGKALLAEGRTGEAMVELEKARDLKHPDNAVLPLLAQGMLAMRQIKKLTDVYGNTSLTDPIAHAALKALVASAFGAQGKLDLCEANVKQALQLDAKNATARLLNAHLMAGRGEMDLALAVLEGLLAEQPKNAQAWRVKGDILALGKRDAVGGSAAYKQALQLQPKYTAAHVSLINAALQRGDMVAFKTAVDEMSKALPGHPDTLLYEAQSALVVKNFAVARNITQKLLRAAPENALVLQTAGAVELDSGSLAQAERHLSKALQFEPRLLAARRLLAEAHLRSGLPDKALVDLKPLLEQPNVSAAVLAAAAGARLQNGQLAEAESLFARAAKLAPDDPKLSTALALTQIAKGNTQGGFAELESIAARDSGTYSDMALISARLKQNDLNAALQALDRLQKKQPNSAVVHQIRGQIHVRHNDLAAARASFERANALDPKYFPALASLVDLDVVDKKPEAAIARLEAELSREPGNYRALGILASLRQRTGAPPESIKALLAAAVKASPDQVAPRLLHGEYLLGVRDFSGAKAAAQDAISAIPNDLQLLDLLGRAQLAAGEAQQALSAFGKVASAHPESAEAQLRLAEAQIQGKDTAGATRSLRKVLEIDPRSVSAQTRLVQLALADRRTEEAIRIAKSVQRQQPRKAAGYLLEGEVHAFLRKPGPALAAFRAAFELEKSSVLAMRVHSATRLAISSADADRFALAWLKDHPKDVAFLIHLGVMAMDDRQLEAAERHFKAVVALQADTPSALNNLAWVLLQQGKPGALEHAERANFLAPDQAAYMDTLAAALAAEGQHVKALDLQRRALARAPEGAAAGYRLRLAKLLLKTGDSAKARTELETLKALGDKFPGQDEVTALLKGKAAP